MPLDAAPKSNATSKSYAAFISYSHKDRAAAKWLHDRIERFPIDAELVGRDTGRGAIPKRLAPVFRDRDDFTAGHSLTEQTIAALDGSAALIVICSPDAAQSHSVNEEIRLFRQRHAERAVIPFIVAGAPNGADECFAPALRFHVGADGQVTGERNEVLGADWRADADGRELALAKVIARLLGLSTDDVFRRAERARRRAGRIRTGLAAAMLALAVTGGALAWMYSGARTVVVRYDAALERYCHYYLEKVREQCDRRDVEATFKRIAEAAAEGRDPRNAEILRLVEAARSAEAAPLMRALAAEEAARGQAQVKRAAQRFRDSGLIAFASDTKAALADYSEAVRLDPDNASGWNQLGDLQRRIGDLDAASKSYERVLSLGNRLADQTTIAVAIGNLGLVYASRGNLDAAEDNYNRALAIDTALGDTRGIAVSYSNLGDVYQTRGALEAAEEKYKQALDLFKTLGDKESLAIIFSNLGDINFTREEFDLAEGNYKLAFELFTALRIKEGLAGIHGSLGNISRRRGNSDAAEAGYKQAIAIQAELGIKEAIAKNYNNLGLVYFDRNDLDAAETAYKKALDISIVLGAKKVMAGIYANLGTVYAARQDIGRMEAMYGQALAIEKALGAKDGMASGYARLGILYKARGDMRNACGSWGKARDLLQEVGVKPKVALVEGYMREAGCSE